MNNIGHCMGMLRGRPYPDEFGEPFWRYVNSDLKGFSIFPCGL